MDGATDDAGLMSKAEAARRLTADLGRYVDPRMVGELVDIQELPIFLDGPAHKIDRAGYARLLKLLSPRPRRTAEARGPAA